MPSHKYLLAVKEKQNLELPLSDSLLHCEMVIIYLY